MKHPANPQKDRDGGEVIQEIAGTSLGFFVEFVRGALSDWFFIVLLAALVMVLRGCMGD
jgi:hypothetical protein